jgi:cbb3-type cytochrome oxidase subunit 3
MIMGFVSETLSGIEGIQLFYIFGLLLFIGMFIGVVLYAYKIPRKDLLKFKSSIFENDELKN